MLLALRDGQVINITAETYVAGDQIIQNISHIIERALTAVEAADEARSIVAHRHQYRQYRWRQPSSRPWTWSRTTGRLSGPLSS
jgi:hypothetical protein